jgi:nucleoside-diphosphate-sugar epimerase
MTVLVTGAAGFLGSHVTEMLAASGEQPRALIRPDESIRTAAHIDVEIHVGDIADHACLERALRGVDRVLHCAARTGPWGAEADYERTNVQGLETLVRAALAAGVQRVVHVSSATVHGIDLGGAADETAPMRDERYPYTRSKVAGERVLERLIQEEGAPVTIVRPGWIYGPRDHTSFARLARMIDTRRMVMAGAGRNHLPLIYVGDVVRGVLLACQATQAVGRSYLLVNDELVTQREFLSAIAAELGCPPPARQVPYRLGLMAGAVAESVGRSLRSGKPPRVTRFGLKLLGGENRFSITRARQELGFSPLVDMAEGVRRTVDWYRETYGVTEPPASVPERGATTMKEART